MTLNLTPMIDIVFNLLVYFLVVGIVHLAEGALPARLPATHGEMTGIVPLSPIVLKLQAEADRCRVTLEPYGWVFERMSDLYDRLAELAASPDFGKDIPVIIVPDDEVVVDFVADAYNAAYTAGFTQIGFAQ